MKLQATGTQATTVVITSVALLFGVAFALVVAIGGYKIAFMALAAVLGLFAFALPIELLMRALLLVSVFISGVLHYFTPLGNNAYWMAVGLAAVLAVRIPIDLLSRRRAGDEVVQVRGGGSLRTASTFVLAIALGFPLTVIVSTLANHNPIDQTLLGVKAYFGYWPLMYVMALGLTSEKFIAWAWKVLFWAAVVQVPFVAFQRIFIMPQRLQGASEFDSIVGTMGGDPFGGGSNATLVLYCLVTFYLGLNYLRVGLRRPLIVAVMSVIALACIFAGEVKAVIAFLPIGLTATYWDALRKKPIRFVYMIFIAGGFAMLVTVAYQVMYWSKNQELTGASQDENIVKSLTYAFDSNQVSVTTGELSRAAVISLWNEDVSGDLPKRWLGYGMFSSRSSTTFAMGEVAAKYYPLNLNWTTAAALLWDFGLLGLSTFFALQIATIFLILKISRHPALPPEARAQVHVAFAVLLIGLPFHFYQNYVYLHPPTQWLYYFCIGYVIHLARTLPDVEVRRRYSMQAATSMRGVVAAHADAHFPVVAPIRK
ncbi:hypothetical protein [Derxia gummosa]|uniref:Uncharacterized protein n=1 Tax=Derxia gummosa DSM 723 TaxID=1121388 RepID=A0A8B6X8N0_9BURK|nr:hypothetical protein [Derxia gummosa]